MVNLFKARLKALERLTAALEIERGTLPGPTGGGSCCLCSLTLGFSVLHEPGGTHLFPGPASVSFPVLGKLSVWLTPLKFQVST